MLVTRGADGQSSSLLHELREVVQEVCVTGAACTNAVASASEKTITFNITWIMKTYI